MNTNMTLELPLNTPPARNAADCTTSQIMYATRTLVDSLLANNVGNRPISHARVMALASDMRSGRWQVNGSTIVTDRLGRLIDGQHRLTACREAGYPAIPLLVVTLPTCGADSNEVFRTVDSGKSRSMADALGVEQVKNAAVIAAAARVIVLIYKGVAAIPTKSEMHEVFANLREHLEIYARYGKRQSGIIQLQSSNVAAMAVMSYLSGRMEDVKAFADRVIDGANLDRNSPEYKLISFMSTRRNRHVTCETQLALFCATWRCLFYSLFRTGRAMRSCRGRDDQTCASIRRLSNDKNLPIFSV